LFKRGPDDYEIELDVVPFGQIEGPPGEIHWPPGGEIVMTVLGFQEAVDTAEPVDIGEDLVVPVVTLSAFVLLKLFAWKDRRLQKNTDAGDILFVLRNYFQAGNIERIFEHALDLLKALGSDPVLAAAGLLGRGVRNLTSAETQAALQALLHAPEDAERLRTDLEARAATLLGGFVDDSDALLATFTKQLLSMGDANGDPGGPAAGA
jgi:predicted nucleotidyltransferase